MDLSINFECPECRKVQPLKMADFSPGQKRTCHDCGAATELTEAGVVELEFRLRELFRG
jgi:hypothetical protein